MLSVSRSLAIMSMARLVELNSAKRKRVNETRRFSAHAISSSDEGIGFTSLNVITGVEFFQTQYF